MAASFKDQQKNRQQHTGREGRRRGDDTNGSDQRRGGRQDIKVHGGADGGQKKNKRLCVRGTRGKQRLDRWAPQRPPTEAVEGDNTDDDGGKDSVRWGGIADRRIDAGRLVVLLWSSPRHKFILQNRGEKRQPTARATSPPSALKCEAINGSHGFTSRHTSVKRRRLRFEIISRVKLDKGATGLDPTKRPRAADLCPLSANSASEGDEAGARFFSVALWSTGCVGRSLVSSFAVRAWRLSGFCAPIVFEMAFQANPAPMHMVFMSLCVPAQCEVFGETAVVNYGQYAGICIYVSECICYRARIGGCPSWSRSLLYRNRHGGAVGCQPPLPAPPTHVSAHDAQTACLRDAG